MRFPERARRGDAAHTEAIEQLDEARAERNRLTDLADAAKGTPREAGAADARDTARDRFAAREASLFLHRARRLARLPGGRRTAGTDRHCCARRSFSQRQTSRFR